MKKYKFIIYSTKEDTFIQPAGRKIPKAAVHKWEIECEYQLCNKRLKLQGHISNIDQIEELLNKLLIDIRDIPLTEGDSGNA
jgi:hypothetical protein